jgi:hypothetical protein
MFGGAHLSSRFAFSENSSAGVRGRTDLEPSSPSRPNEAIVWNQLMLEAIEQSNTPPPAASRAMACESLAVFNAVSAVNGTPGYRSDLQAPEGASAAAAAAQAAHDILVDLFPEQAGMFDAQLAQSLGAIANSQSKSDGIAAGKQAADAMIALRADDGWNAPSTYTADTELGSWHPTPPGYLPGLAPQWADMEPFALTDPDQFLPPGPPALTSRAFAKAFNEVKSLGEVDSEIRTDDQTEIARFWAYGANTNTPPGCWNEIATTIAHKEGLSLAATAELLAVLNVAEADAAIACWDSKYEYDFWRPVTAIQNAGDVGNRWITEDPGWLPLLTTPPFPEYVSGHSTFSGAAAEVLASYFGTNYEFEFTSASGATREFDSFRAAAQEAGMSRIYGGIHYNFANKDGLALGRNIADWTIDALDPVHDMGGGNPRRKLMDIDRGGNSRFANGDEVELSGVGFAANEAWG